MGTFWKTRSLSESLEFTDATVPMIESFLLHILVFVIRYTRGPDRRCPAPMLACQILAGSGNVFEQYVHRICELRVAAESYAKNKIKFLEPDYPNLTHPGTHSNTKKFIKIGRIIYIYMDVGRSFSYVLHWPQTTEIEMASNSSSVILIFLYDGHRGTAFIDISALRPSPRPWHSCSDQSVRFESTPFLELSRPISAKHVRTTPYHPCRALSQNSEGCSNEPCFSWMDALPSVLLGLHCPFKEDVPAVVELIYGTSIRLFVCLMSFLQLIVTVFQIILPILSQS